MSNRNKKDYIFAVGRRREAVCRVRLFRGKGENLVNNYPAEEYFPGEVQNQLWKRPFQLTQTEDKYYVTAKVEGGGKSGQLGAFIHGVSRALSKIDEEKRLILRRAGLLTRDPREKERRKVGTGGKARRKKQSPKR
jgi:small subunit ribosomal protein S9